MALGDATARKGKYTQEELRRGAAESRVRDRLKPPKEPYRPNKPATVSPKDIAAEKAERTARQIEANQRLATRNAPRPAPRPTFAERTGLGRRTTDETGKAAREAINIARRQGYDLGRGIAIEESGTLGRVGRALKPVRGMLRTAYNTAKGAVKSPAVRAVGGSLVKGGLQGAGMAAEQYAFSKAYGATKKAVGDVLTRTKDRERGEQVKTEHVRVTPESRAGWRGEPKIPKGWRRYTPPERKGPFGSPLEPRFPTDRYRSTPEPQTPERGRTMAPIVPKFKRDDRKQERKPLR